MTEKRVATLVVACTKCGHNMDIFDQELALHLAANDLLAMCECAAAALDTESEPSPLVLRLGRVIAKAKGGNE